LKAQQIPLGYWESLKLTFAGNFLNFATPLGSNAGDVFKAYFVALHTDHKTEAATTVFLDRVVGLCSLLLVVALITILSPAERLVSLRPYMLGVLGIVVAGIVFYLSPLFRALLQLSWLRRLPFFGQLERIDMTARTLFGRPGLLVAGVAITLVLQATAMSAYFIVAKAVGLDVLLEQIAEVFAYFFVGCLVQALPGPPQGLGTVELTYRYFFSPFGTVSQILCMAFLIRLMVLLCAVPGVLVTMTGSYRPSTSEPETETELGPKTTDLASASEAVVR
ncbi:MAG: lysylphosphatidylglycerol synthase transmembrane domain-containing protein, partial [Phycisphaerae bacterium]